LFKDNDLLSILGSFSIYVEFAVALIHGRRLQSELVHVSADAHVDEGGRVVLGPAGRDGLSHGGVRNRQIFNHQMELDSIEKSCFIFNG